MNSFAPEQPREELPPFPEDIVPTQKAGLALIVTMAIAQFGLFVALLAPVTVSLALKIQEIVDADQSATALGTVLSVAAFVALVANPVVGRLSDLTTSRWGRRRPWMIWGCIVFLVGLATIAIAGSISLVLIGWAISQLGGNMILAPLLTTIADQVPEKQRGGVSANVGVMQNVGILVAAYVASWFVHNTFMLFLVPGLFAVATVVLYCVVLPDRQVRVHPSKGGIRTFLGTFWTNPVKYPDFGWAWLSRFCFILASFMFITFRLYFLQDQVNLTTENAVNAITVGLLIYTAALVVFAKVGGWLSDKLGRRKIFVILAVLIFAIGTYLLVHVTTLAAFYWVEAVMGIGAGIYWAVDMALVIDVLPNPDDAAKDLGVMNIANALPQSLAGVVGSIFLAVGGGGNYFLLYVMAAVIALAGAAAIIPIKKVR